MVKDEHFEKGSRPIYRSKDGKIFIAAPVEYTVSSGKELAIVGLFHPLDYAKEQPYTAWVVEDTPPVWLGWRGEGSEAEAKEIYDDPGLSWYRAENLEFVRASKY